MWTEFPLVLKSWQKNGIKFSNIDFLKTTASIGFEPSEISKETIKSIIEKSGQYKIK